MQSLLTTTLRVSLGRRQWAAPAWAVLLALVVAGLFLRLGDWQLGRADEKVRLAARFESRHHLAPMDLAAVLARGSDVDDLPLRVQGRYDNSRLVYLDNQQHAGRAGLHVFTLFFPAGEHRGLLVDRGWIPVGPDMQKVPAVPAATATEVSGTAALPSPYFTVGTPDYHQRPLRVARLDLDRLGQALGVALLPFTLRLDAAAPDGFVREWSPAARLGMLPEQHRAYAFQWFALAAAVLVVLLVVNLKKSTT